MIKSYPKDKDKPKPENLIPVASYRVNYLSKVKKKNKFNAKKQTYNGVKFDSTFEAKVAENLDWLLKSGELVEVKRQVKIPLMVNQKLICNFYCDFRTVDKHGQVNYVEAKGMVLPVYAIKQKLFLALLPEIDNGATFELVKA